MKMQDHHVRGAAAAFKQGRRFVRLRVERAWRLLKLFEGGPGL